MLYTFILFLITSDLILGAFDLKPVNQSGQGDGLWISFYNPYPAIACDPAALTGINKARLFTSRWHPWMIQEIKVDDVWVAIPRGKIYTGAGLFQVGHQYYREKTLWLGIASRLTRTLKAGLAINSNSVAIGNYGQAGAVTITASVHHSFSKWIAWGLVIDNPFNATTGRTKEPLPHGTVVSIVSGNEKMRIQGEWKIGSYLSSGPALNMTYTPWKKTILSLTTRGKPRTIKCSIQLNLDQLHVSYSAQYSIYMQRITHQVGFGISAGRTRGRYGQGTGSNR